MKTGKRDYLQRQSGFSLVEIMVGMVIGMLGIIVMMQVYTVSEARKRTTTAGSEAQNDATIALDMMQRDISRSGYGFSNKNLLNCNLQLPNGAPIPLVPVTINPAATVIPPGDTNTDTVLVSYGVSDDQPDGYSIFSQSGATYTIVGTGMMKQADRAIASPEPCGATTLTLGSVQAVNASTITLSSSATGTALFNLGASPKFLAYAVRSGSLTVCDYMANNCGSNSSTDLANPNIWRPIVSNVVSLRAQYVHTTGTQYDKSTPATCTGWATTLALRFALVTRSAQYEKSETDGQAAIVTAVAPTWSGSASGTWSSTDNSNPNINLSGTLTEWQSYRYRVFETTTPIRNIAWGISGC